MWKIRKISSQKTLYDKLAILTRKESSDRLEILDDRLGHPPPPIHFDGTFKFGVRFRIGVKPNKLLIK